MFRYELSSFLKRVLDAVDQRKQGLSVGPGGMPDVMELGAISITVGAELDEVKSALEGLLATSCLVEHEVDFPGIEPVVWWQVHPQVQRARAS